MTTIDFSLVTVLTHITLSLGLFYSCFCRLTKTDKHTPLRVRMSFYLMANVTLVLAGAPFFWGLIPNAWINCLLGACLLTKIVSSELWRYGVPKSYLDPSYNVQSFTIKKPTFTKVETDPSANKFELTNLNHHV